MNDEQAVEIINDDAVMNTPRRPTPARVDDVAEGLVRAAFIEAEAGVFGRLADFAGWWAGRAASNEHPSRIRLLVFGNAESSLAIAHLPSNVSVRHVAIPESVSEAAHVGMHVIDDEVDYGTDLILIGHMSNDRGNEIRPLTTALVVHETGADLVDAMGSDLDDLTWMNVAQRARQAHQSLRECQTDDVIQRLGSPDIASLVAALQQAAARGVPVLIDGATLAASALVAEHLSPGSRTWWYASHRSQEQSEALALDSLGMEPMLDLGMHIGNGRGALLALPLLLASIDIADTVVSAHKS
jgi:nicotinate-nucleotide--dimethylbenzimidazole phosphoribosyltransferase